MMEGAAVEEAASAAPWTRWRSSASQKLQQVLDRWTPFPLYRWLGVLLLGLVYAVRVYYLEGFYIITYALGIYVLGLLIAFLSPQVDPDFEGPGLPTKGSDEFKPFIRRLPEFKFWYSLSKAICLSFVLTFFPILDVPVFWPILVVYWVVIAFLTLRRQIRHMIKHKYVPFSVGKQRYSGKPAASTEKGLGEENSGETDAAEALDEHSDRLLPA